jgi:hypothetical protein
MNTDVLIVGAGPTGLTAMATIKSAPKRALRNFVLRMLGLIPAARHRLEMNLSGLSRRAAAPV